MEYNETNEICRTIELMGKDMTDAQKERVLSAIKEDAGEEDLEKITWAALSSDSPIYADLREYSAEMGFA